MLEEKKDNLKELLSVDRELQKLTEKLEENRKQAEKISEADDITHQVYKENTDILDELAYCWKGDKATQFLHIAHEDNESEYNQFMRILDDTYLNLEDEQKSLVNKEDLLTKQSKLKQERY